MASRSAAAARCRRRSENDLEARLRRLLLRADRLERNRLAERLLPASFRDDSATSAVAPEARLGFYWLRIAGWLGESFGLTATARGRKLFDDLCWIQYCVYCLFRAQDDLVDGECGEPLLAVEANQLTVEAARCAARWFEGASPFWEIFQDAVDRTSRALVALDDLQRKPEREAHAELGLYVDLGASLKLAAAGVAVASGREREWRERISPALDHLAVAGQVLDDLEDVEDDLAAGRINYAAWWLSRPVFGETREALAAVVAFSLATGDRLGGLVEVARRRAVAAADVLGPAICPPVHRYLGIYRCRIDGVEAAIERRRSALFAPRRPRAA